MSDSKSTYSEVSKYYVNVTVPQNDIDRRRYVRSKDREKKWNQNWLKNKVNVNEVVDRFVPKGDPKRSFHTEGGVKFDFEGTRYKIKCDKVADYLRIFDKKTKKFCKLDGTPSKYEKETHFKIKRRGEM